MFRKMYILNWLSNESHSQNLLRKLKETWKVIEKSSKTLIIATYLVWNNNTIHYDSNLINFFGIIKLILSFCIPVIFFNHCFEQFWYFTIWYDTIHCYHKNDGTMQIQMPNKFFEISYLIQLEFFSNNNDCNDQHIHIIITLTHSFNKFLRSAYVYWITTAPKFWFINFFLDNLN